MKKKLLIIEDDRNIRELMQLEFVDSGYKVVAVENAFKGLEAFRENKIDLILLDMKLPGMDGLEALEKFLVVDKGLPVIIHSAFSDFQDNYLSWKATDFIVKSGNLDPLKESVRKHLYGSLNNTSF